MNIKIILIVVTFFNWPIFSQKFDKKIIENISEFESKRIVKFLSSDELKGRSASELPDIELSAKFIEGEFEKIGLEYFSKFNSYRQPFGLCKIKKKSILLDSLQVDVNDIIALTYNSKVIFDDCSNFFFIEKDQIFAKEFFGILRDTTTKIVFIDKEHEKSFRNTKSNFNHVGYYSKVLEKPFGSCIFILVKNIEKNRNHQILNVEFEPIMNNLVGFIKGKIDNEYVILSAHYDHLGTFQNSIPDSDSIANGADDNASGISSLIQIAKSIKKINLNNRGLIISAFTGEEDGLLGSKAFTKIIDPKKIVAVINIDMVGKVSKWGENKFYITGYDKSNLYSIFHKNLKAINCELKSDPYKNENLYNRSDNAPFANLGIPAHTFSTAQIDNDKFYHTEKDEFETINFRNLTKITRALAIGTLNVLNSINIPKQKIK